MAGDVRPYILVVDDDVLIRRLLSKYLEMAGYAVCTAASGEEAIQRIMAEPELIQLLVTDIDMPGMSGVELAIKATRLCGCPVLLISGSLLESEASDTYRGWNFLAKPFHAQVFLHKVERALKDLCGSSPRTGARHRREVAISEFKA
jgi:two-component system, OmpR family, lantibiotic biosynthesis response regulator NisR/SpaR